MTIVSAFHSSPYRKFKAFSVQDVLGHWRAEVPGLGSYARFGEFLPPALVPFWAYLRQGSGSHTGIPCVDATALAVCHNRRIAQHRGFAGLAARGKPSRGWCFGFKLHLLGNDKRELLSVALTPGNTNDRNPVPRLAQRLFGKLFADKGSLAAALTRELLEPCRVRLFTPLNRKLTNRLLSFVDKRLLRQRAGSESIIAQLQTSSQIAHSRHRSGATCCGTLLGGLIASCHQPKKPSLHLPALPSLSAA
jgi:hypothetical protein